MCTGKKRGRGEAPSPPTTPATAEISPAEYYKQQNHKLADKYCDLSEKYDKLLTENKELRRKLGEVKNILNA